MPDRIPLLNDIRHCRLCAHHLPLGPRPVVRASATARLLIIGQAPGTRVHHSGIPWDDASGQRLRQWLGMSHDVFYDDNAVAIMPMGFCYPGKGKSGDLPPRSECAPQWHAQLLAAMPNIRLTLLIGQYAQNYYLHDEHRNLSERVAHWRDFPQNFFALPHPSPRNQLWLKKHPWFEQEAIPALQQRIHRLLENTP
ncbi:MAG: uracil-DNA glycosylase family protein [Saccharospirillaceae bacterium]|nr:uracil-DNA glycosylase family protein [Saccharospirillaceae bacterium]MCD8530734.1 uracil-DNA glycosylase family protein [Saccharospirillaceae bacterium]